MVKLTPEEIRFVNETKFTPTVYQLDEYPRTIFKNFDEAQTLAKKIYNFDLNDFLRKNLEQDDIDSISLEYVATYLFYSFFSKEDLNNMTPEFGLKWLQDYRYYNGFRKWDLDYICNEIKEALEIYSGKREFYITEDNQIWNREVKYDKE